MLTQNIMTPFWKITATMLTRMKKMSTPAMMMKGKLPRSGLPERDALNTRTARGAMCQGEGYGC